MVLIHDIVEIDAGDTFVYDTAGNESKAQREQAAARRLFGLLPSDQALEFHRLWEEFEAGATPEARLTQALDRLQAVLQNLETNGASWRRNGITKAQVIAFNQKIGESLPTVWQEILGRLENAEAQGYFSPANPSPGVRAGPDSAPPVRPCT